MTPRLVAEVAGEFDPSAGDDGAFRFPFGHGRVDAASYLLHSVVTDRRSRAGDDRLLAVESLYRVLRAAVGRAYRDRELDRPSRVPTARAHRDAVEATKELLTRSFCAGLPLQEIAREVHMSPYHLARVFRRTTGFTLHAYRNQIRLRSALDRIREPRLDLSRLAVELGFSSHSHFTDSFRRLFGRPPSAIRAAGPRTVRELRKELEATSALAS